jgi:hypothetical protein
MQVGFVKKGEPYTDPLDAWIDRSGSRFPATAEELSGLSDDALDALIRTVEQDAQSNDAAASFVKGERVMELARALVAYRAGLGGCSVCGTEDSGRMTPDSDRCIDCRTGINGGQARRIASEWHDGQGSALYSFVSTGAIALDALDGEIVANLDRQLDDSTEQRELDALLAYVHSNGERGPVAGWADLWSDSTDNIDPA